MKNRILAALLALVLGVPLYLLAADAVPTAAAKTVSSAAPAQAVALLRSARLIAAIEALEYVRQILRSDDRAEILHGENRLSAAADQRDPHATVLRLVFQRVFNQS